MAEPIRLLYCNCTYAQVVPKEVKAAVLKELCDSGVAFEAVADLCEMSARRDPALKRLAQAGTIKIAACYPRAVKWLFAAAQAPLPEGGAEVLNMRVQSAQEVKAALFNPQFNANLPVDRRSPPLEKAPENPQSDLPAPAAAADQIPGKPLPTGGSGLSPAVGS